MDKLKRFIDILVPVTTCTLRCHYCYTTHHRLFGGPLPKFSYTPETFRKALSQRRLGGVCMFNFCGGRETLLPPEVPEFVKALLDEGHYVMVVTNATTDRAFDVMEKWPQELVDRLFFKFSYHYLELKERNLFNKFFRNIKRMRDVGASFTLEATPSDELVPFIEDMKRQSKAELGAWCHVTVPRSERDMSTIPLLSNMSPDEFYNTWKVFDSPFFEYKFSVFGKKQTGFCHGGDWTMWLSMEEKTCRLCQCYCSYFSQDILSDINRPLSYHSVGHNCPLPHCYNAHAFLTFGTIAERNDPTYDVMRNRVCDDGTEWLKPRMKAFMSQRLRDNNEEYSAIKKFLSDMYIRRIKGTRGIRKILSSIKRHIACG